MSNILSELNAISLDALREVGNIGLGSAMTALSTLLDRGVNMSLPDVEVIGLPEFAALAGGEEGVSACVYMPVTGDADGHVAFLLPEPCACRLVDTLMGMEAGTTQELDEVGCSALMEIGNILASSYLVALCELTGLALHSAPPALALDMTVAILASVAATFAETEDQALTIVTRVGEAGSGLEGFFLYVPEPESVPVLMRALGMEMLSDMPRCVGKEAA